MPPLTPTISRVDRLRQLETEVRARNADLARDLWRMGNTLREVRRDELWRDGGYKGFDSWLAATGVTGRTTAYKAMRVSRVFAEEMAARFGTEKLVAALSYLNATSKEEQPGDLLAVQVRVRDEDGAWAAVPFVEASASQIREAASSLGQQKRRRALPAELRKRVTRLNKRVARSKGGDRSARLRLRRNKAGKVMVSLTSVPLDEFETYVAKVRAELRQDAVGGGAGAQVGDGEAGVGAKS